MVSQFISGLTTMGFCVAGAFFLRFWHRTGDGLFAAFAIAFWLFALNQGLAVFLSDPREDQSWIYLLRLAGFALIIAAIIRKNMAPAQQPPE